MTDAEFAAFLDGVELNESDNDLLARSPATAARVEADIRAFDAGLGKIVNLDDL